MDQVDRTHHTRRKQLTDMMNWCRHRRPHPGAAALASAAWTRPRNFFFARSGESESGKKIKKLHFFALALALALALGLVRKCSFDADLKASASARAGVKKIKQLKSRSACACACACACLVTQTP
jgi:hypothetical protein